MRLMMILTALAACSVTGVRAGLMEDANELYGEGRYKEAVKLYKKAADQGHNQTLAYFNIANAYFQMDDLPQSIVYYRSSVMAAPDFFRGHLNLAIAYYTLTDYSAAIASCRRAVELEPDHIRANLLLATCYHRLEGYAMAAPILERITFLEPTLDEPYIMLGEIYRELKDPEEAVYWLSRYPDDGPNLQYVLLLSADIYEERGDYEKAVYYLRQAFDLNSTRKWIYYRIVLLYARMENFHVALDQARDGVSLFPNFAELLLMAGNLAVKVEEYPLAEQLYARAYENGSANALVGLENIKAMRQAAVDGFTDE